VADVLTWHLLLPFMLMYVLVAICVFGIFVPAGNFIPALTIGAVADTRSNRRVRPMGARECAARARRVRSEFSRGQ